MTRQIFWFLVFSGLFLLLGTESFLPGSCGYSGPAALFAPRCPEFIFIIAFACCFIMMATSHTFANRGPAGEKERVPESETPVSQAAWRAEKNPGASLETRMRESGFSASPELQRWLDGEFPPGTRDDVLRHTLKDKGYTGIGIAVYKSDPSVCSAAFQPRTLVFWKVDAARRVVWTKGFQASAA